MNEVAHSPVVLRVAVLERHYNDRNIHMSRSVRLVAEELPETHRLWPWVVASRLQAVVWRDVLELKHALDAGAVPVLPVMEQTKQLDNVFRLYSDVNLHV